MLEQSKRIQLLLLIFLLIKCTNPKVSKPRDVVTDEVENEGTKTYEVEQRRTLNNVEDLFYLGYGKPDRELFFYSFVDSSLVSYDKENFFLLRELWDEFPISFNNDYWGYYLTTDTEKSLVIESFTDKAPVSLKLSKEIVALELSTDGGAVYSTVDNEIYWVSNDSFSIKKLEGRNGIVLGIANDKAYYLDYTENYESPYADLNSISLISSDLTTEIVLDSISDVGIQMSNLCERVLYRRGDSVFVYDMENKNNHWVPPYKQSWQGPYFADEEAEILYLGPNNEIKFYSIP